MEERISWNGRGGEVGCLSEAREGKLSTYARGEVPVDALVPEALICPNQKWSCLDTCIFSPYTLVLLFLLLILRFRAFQSPMLHDLLVALAGLCLPMTAPRI